MQLERLNREVVSSDDKVKGVTVLMCADTYVLPGRTSLERRLVERLVGCSHRRRAGSDGESTVSG